MESKKSFEDHFSQQAQDYALYRPTYPAELFAHLAWIAPSRLLAWHFSKRRIDDSEIR